ncbi:monooxygenase [Devosia yakushimensis]|uniref:Dibenzothiophene monooxygenase n=1 Tax=Devosia yakushimensis TaxID=470028 RepID=A0ABQ5UE35_9HYPH|nr:acyl-CoA dehydrogenase family protein [Devosia yakushimensis]GLQ09460.1 monooxygenase [Devosia yakushimensis]
MTNISQAWGAGPSDRFDTIAAPFRQIFARIRERAVARDVERDLPREEIRWLKDAGFSTLRLPVENGGLGLTLPEFFGLLIELSEADPNITNAYRSHFGFTEDVINAPKSEWRNTWLTRLGQRETIGSGFSETGDGKIGTYSTRLIRNGDGWQLNGEKYYTTGSLYADWITLGAADDEGNPIGALVPTGATGVEILDDWDGFGQALSASGTARFNDVAISDDLIKPSAARFSYSGGFFQLVHLATLAGIGRAAAGDLARHVSERKRVYGRGNASRSAQDPQILQVVGKVRGAAYVSGAIALKAAEALQRAFEANQSGDAARKAEADRNADLEVSQSVTVITSLILDASTVLFDALGASAAKRSHGLDRHWRNARTIASHNPRIYHDRIVGDFAVNGNAPAPHGGIGVAAPQQEAKAQA